MQKKRNSTTIALLSFTGSYQCTNGPDTFHTMVLTQQLAGLTERLSTKNFLSPAIYRKWALYDMWSLQQSPTHWKLHKADNRKSLGYNTQSSIIYNV